MKKLEVGIPTSSGCDQILWNNWGFEGVRFGSL
jgi:hypothetical protein